MKALKDGSFNFKATDVFKRKMIVIPEKLLDEKANAWFKKYISELDPETDMTAPAKREEICSYLKDNFKFNDGHFSVWIIYHTSKPFGNMGETREQATYKLTDSTGLQTVIFDHFNGYWYTATKTGKEHKVIMFDYGDFYSMVDIFPLAHYFYRAAEEFAEKGRKE